MKAQVEHRLHQLQQEFESGQRMLADYEAREAELRQTLLRISGAIQVLEEMLNGEAQPANGAGPDEVPRKTAERL
jgi:hypothetical protein